MNTEYFLLYDTPLSNISLTTDQIIMRCKFIKFFCQIEFYKQKNAKIPKLSYKCENPENDKNRPPLKLVYPKTEQPKN